MERLLTVRRYGTVAGRGVFGVVGGASAITARLGRGAEQALDRLEQIAVGVQAMHGEMVGMREDLQRVDVGVAGLRDELAGLREGVGRSRRTRTAWTRGSSAWAPAWNRSTCWPRGSAACRSG